jgi:hypothetical protein
MMKFFAHCNDHSRILVTKASGILKARYEHKAGGWYELDLDSFDCPTAKDMGQDGLYVGMAGAQYICRKSWTLQHIDDIREPEPEQVLVDKKEIQGVLDQLKRAANRLGALIGLSPSTE